MGFKKAAEVAINKLHSQYPEAIRIFGGAYFATEYVHCEKPDFKKFTDYLPALIRNATLYQWHEGVEGALNTFCHLCMVDPKLIECYLGKTFSEIAKHY